VIRKAFTLIELLVVIAIIAILAAILFPVFAQAKEAAKASQVLVELQQMGLSVQLYASDYDDTIVPWLTPSNSWPIRNIYRDDRLTWVQNVQPYMKNGNPTVDRTKYNTQAKFVDAEVPPAGMMYSPVWTKQKWYAASDAADCDGTGAPGSGLVAAGYGDLSWIHAHFGIGFGVKASVNPDFTNNYAGTCTNAVPWFWFAGSDTFGVGTGTPTIPPNNNSGISGPVRYDVLTMSLGQVTRPAETCILTDGFTGNVGTGPFGTGVTCGCESANMYHGGGNLAFLDTHAKFVRGNSERYLDKDSGGCVYKRYYTVDK